MKRIQSLLLALALALALTACGGTGETGGSAFSADLTEFYATLFQGEEAPMMMELTGETLEQFYPGLEEIGREQTVVYAAAMSAVAAEVAMVEVTDAADVERVQEIFQARIDAQTGADGSEAGAFYPETVEAWETQSEIVTQGNYVCLFVGADKDQMVADFQALGQQG